MLSKRILPMIVSAILAAALLPMTALAVEVQPGRLMAGASEAGMLGVQASSELGTWIEGGGSFGTATNVRLNTWYSCALDYGDYGYDYDDGEDYGPLSDGVFFAFELKNGGPVTVEFYGAGFAWLFDGETHEQIASFDCYEDDYDEDDLYGVHGSMKAKVPGGRYVISFAYDDWYGSDECLFAIKASDPGGNASPKSVLKATTGDKIRDFRYLDSAKTQAVAITATGTYSNGGPRYKDGRVWFVSNGKAQELYSSPSIVASDERMKLYSVQNGKMFVVEGEAGVVSSRSHAWFIKDGVAKELPSVGGNLTMTSKNEFAAFHSTYDKTHSWKHYYYHWNGKKLVEYGGKEISQAQLKRAKNGKKCLKVIGKLGKIGKIYYRANGIINVNYKNGNLNGNVTLKYKSGKVSYAKVNTYGKTKLARATDAGVYKKRNPDNAGRVSVSYPSSLPAKLKASATDDMRSRYKKVLSQARSGKGVFASAYYAQSNHSWWNASYTVYDAGGDGTPELFVHAGYFSADTKWYAFTMKSGKAKCLGTFGTGQTSLYGGKGGKLYGIYEHGSTCIVTLVSLKGGSISETRKVTSTDDIHGHPKVAAFKSKNGLSYLGYYGASDAKAINSAVVKK